MTAEPERQQIRTALAQIEVIPGRPQINTATMLREIEAARQDGAELIVFPEMAIPGYLIGDEWERLSFLRECEECGERIREASQDLTIVFGNVGLDPERCNEDGRIRKYNALFVAENGSFLHAHATPYSFVIKTLLPNYREFDDSRHFFDLRKLALELDTDVKQLIAPLKSRLGSLGCLLCEDAWDGDYAISPVSILSDAGAQVLINISCSPFTLNKNHKRNRVFNAHAEAAACPMIYVNNTGIQNNGKTVYTFDGSSCVYDGHGNCFTPGKPFDAATTLTDIPLNGDALGTPVDLRDDGIEEIFTALQYGARAFLEATGIQSLVVGASGGIDSGVAAALYGTILKPEQLLLVNMPGRYNSDTTRSIAARQAAAMNCWFAEVPIDDSVALTTGQIDGLAITNEQGDSRTLNLSGFMLENVQARDRSSRILAALASAFGGAFTCNANKSELTVGYTTLYGDLGGCLAVLADLWKGRVYELGRYLNETVYGREVIPQDCFDIVPSAELSDEQDVDAGKGDPLHYPYHDQLFASWVEWWNRTTPEDILSWYQDGSLAERLGFDGDLQALFPDAPAFVADLERWWNLYRGLGVAKRIQAPPVLAITRRAFGFDHRESQMGAAYSAAYEELKAKISS